MIDIQNDSNLLLLKEAMGDSIPESAIPIIKGTQIDIDYDDLMDEAFADKAHRTLPIFSPGHAAMSAMYLKSQKNNAESSTISRCQKALIAFKLREVADMLDSKEEEQNENMLKTASFEDNVSFILPSRNKLPVANSEMLTKSASIFIRNINTLSLSEKIEGSMNLVKISEEYGVDVSDDRVNSYNMNMDTHLIKVASSLLSREGATADSGYRKIYDAITKIANEKGVILSDLSTQKKIAGDIIDLDSKNGVLGEFDTMIDVFNTPKESIEKVATETVEICGKSMDILKISSITNEDASFIFGKDIDFNSMSNADKITSISEHIESLPSSAQSSVIQLVNTL